MTVTLIWPGYSRPSSILRAMLRLGRDLGLTVVVEGVENGRQRAWLQAEGCRLGQGYALGRPQSLERLLVAARTEQPASVARTPIPARPVTMTF